MPSVRLEVPVGTRYGDLVVLGEAASRRSVGGSVKRYLSCRCDCGTELEVRLNNLRSGRTRSCGCYVPLASCFVSGSAYHGMQGSPEYGVWKGMKKRCYKLKARGYRNYGGRGIKVCERWLHSFKAFHDDMGDRPSKAHSIDRIDGDGDYEPGNCRWATCAEQNRNRRDNRNMTFQGKTMCLKDWADLYRMRKVTLYERLDRGMSLEEALTTPVRKWVRQRGGFQCVMREKHERACEPCGHALGVGCLVVPGA